MQKYFLSLFFSFLSIMVSAQLKPQTIDTRTTIQKFTTLMQLINFYYVEDVDPGKITEEAIIAALKELDPHSVYIPKAEVQRINEPLQGNFDGVGIQFQLFHDTILIITPIPGGPADKLGIRAGDKILKINNEIAFGKKINNQYVFDRLRGQRGTTVDISILRKGQKNLIDYTIKRDKIPINSIDATYMLSEDIGYIKLSRFARNSTDEFKEAVNKLQQQGMKSLVFDLRGNSGGFLDVAYDLADQFLPSGKLIVYTSGNKSSRQDFISRPGGLFETGKLIVLIDEGSASASEIVSGAIQDWDRGVIMGRRSFGKGLVQRPFLLPDSSMVRLTTARYYTPSGRCIQKPYEAGSDEYKSEVYNRMKHGEMIHADSIKFPDSLRYYTQNRRIVYGGGGIMPDFFIPIDTSFISKYYTDIFRKGLLNDFVLQYVENNRNKLLKQYPDIKSFIANFNQDDKLLDEFVAFAETKDLPKDVSGLKVSGSYIKTLTKALLARNIFDMNAYFQVIKQQDDELKRAVEIIGNQSVFNQLDKRFK